jgi:GAF domain-containing protein
MVPLRDSRGEVSHVLIVFSDHTAAYEAREEAEGAARNAERARSAADARAYHSAFLAQAARVLSSSLDLDETLRKVAELAIESFADICSIDLVHADGSFRRVATLHRDPKKQVLLDELRVKYPLLGPPRLSSRALASGQPALIEDLDDQALLQHITSPDERTLVSQLGMRSAIACPLSVGNRTVGTIGLAYTDTGRYSEEDIPLVEALASHAAVAIENARLFRAA